MQRGADTLTGAAAAWSFDDKFEALLAVDLKAAVRPLCNLSADEDAGPRGRSDDRVGPGRNGHGGGSGQLFAAVKGRVTCFTRSLALAPEVRVHCLALGWVRTAWGQTASNAG